jgi:hypothetical protein
MEDQKETIKGRQRSQPTVPAQKNFLFVDANQAKTSRQGRRNARSFVMQKARRENPWSTSKHAAKQRKTGSPESTSPMSSGTPASALTPNTATPSPPLVYTKPDYFPSVEQHHDPLVKREVCADCQIFLCRPGQQLCPRCLLLKPAAPPKDPNNALFDPFRTSSVEIDPSVSELLEHCKYCPSIHTHTCFSKLPSLWHSDPAWLRSLERSRNSVGLCSNGADSFLAFLSG